MWIHHWKDICFLEYSLYHFIKICKILHKGDKLFLKEVERSWVIDRTFCTVDLASNYLNILHEKSLSSLKRHLDLRTEKETLTEALVELSEILKKIITYISTWKRKGRKRPFCLWLVLKKTFHKILVLNCMCRGATYIVFFHAAAWERSTQRIYWNPQVSPFNH